jgi:uncharacterized protein YbjT (DUF2867 family)
MEVAIAGGHGNVARRLGRLLADRGDLVRGLIRNPGHAEELREDGTEPVLCDLEAATPDQIAAAIAGADAVVFAAGAGPGSGPERKWTVDYGAAVKLSTAAEATGTARYVMLSSIGADPDREGDDPFAAYLRAKGSADAELMASGLDYTIVRPTFMTDDPDTGRVRIAEHVSEDERVSRDDVAAVLATVLHHPETAKVVFEVASGDVPIEEAVASVGSPA